MNLDTTAIHLPGLIAQDYEIREWLGGQWDEETTRALIEQIQDAGTDDEEVWIAICQRHDGESIDALTTARRKALLSSSPSTATSARSWPICAMPTCGPSWRR